MQFKTIQITLVCMLFLASCQAKPDRKQQGTLQQESVHVDSIDLALLKSIKQIASSFAFDSLSKNNRIIETGKLFLQTPYLGGTLESEGNEKLVVNLHQLDCTTYLENVLALSNVLENSQWDLSDFLRELEFIRYRNGKLTNYSSRLHYFSDWIFDNEKKGRIKNITQNIGGERYNKTIDFMGTHISAYPALENDTLLVETIINTEKEINKRDHFYIPEQKIQGLEHLIRDGDLIAITTKIKGLDVSHTGIAIHINERLHLMHASSKAKKVVISETPLAEMIQKNRLQSGIIVSRVVLKQ